MYRYVIMQSGGSEIYVNLIASSAGQYLSRQPYVLGLVKEVLTSTKLRGPRPIIEGDMGRVIGNTDIIETTEKDSIFYARPTKKSIFSRYAKNRHPSPSRTLTVILERDLDGNYELLDTWIGSYSPPFPGGEDETAKSKSYWQHHALVQDAQSIQLKTVTRDCPY